MKVILTDEVLGLGGRGEVVSVKDGYARNYLIPKQLAREATPGNLKAAEHEKKKWALLTMQEVESSKQIATILDDMTIVMYKRAGAEGTLFGSVTTTDIADALAEKGITIDKRKIETGHPIKSLGQHVIEAHLHREVTAKFTVDVHPLGEEGAEQVPAAAAPEAVAEAETEAAAEEQAPDVTSESAEAAETASDTDTEQ